MTMRIKYVDFSIMILISFLAISSIRCRHSEKYSSIDKQSSSKDLDSNNGLSRFKRRLQDVAKLMTEDELMALLICDVCDKNQCIPNYCYLCKSCLVEESNHFNYIFDKKSIQNKEIF